MTITLPANGSNDETITISGADTSNVEAAKKEIEKVVKARKKELEKSGKIFPNYSVYPRTHPEMRLDHLYEEQRKGSDKHAEKRAKYFEEGFVVMTCTL